MVGRARPAQRRKDGTLIRVIDAQFLTTAVGPAHFPAPGPPEVAMIGRSNVGKSSMINTLTSRRKLVRVSNTPGRTRTLNFFDVVLEREERRENVRFCDLPGYGFAKVSKSEREGWKEMIGGYLEHRATLKAAVTIIDVEIGPTPDDVLTQEYLSMIPARKLVVATKLDRLPKAKRKPALAAAAAKLEVPLDAVVGFSAKERWGVDEVWGLLWSAALT